MTPHMLVRTLCLPCALACAAVALNGQSLAAKPAHSAMVAGAETPATLSVVVGRSTLIDSPRQIERISVGLGGIAEAIAISPTEVLINGKAPGETTLIVWSKGGGRQFYNVDVRPSAMESGGRMGIINQTLERLLPGQDIHATSENGGVFLTGTAKNLSSSDRAVQIAGMGGKVVNLLNVEVPTANPQILLKVKFASVDLSKTKTLGINVFSNGLGNTIGSVSTGQFSPPTTSSSGTTVASDLNLLAFFPGLGLGATIQALETKGIVQVLAEPNVLTESGKQGSFLAGGEYPYPVVQGGSGGSGSSVTIMFKEYGIRLNFIPTVTPRGTIHLQVAPEVSSLDFSNAVTVSGFTVPAIATRKVKTEIELSEGQSFAIGGLLDNRESQTFQKIPYLSSIPVLGKFFQSISKTKTNTELIVIVTPEIVNPIPGGKPLPMPTFPDTFLDRTDTTPMQTPSSEPEDKKLPPVKTTMPVEDLIKSMKPNPPLSVDGGFTSTGASSSANSSNGTMTQQPQ